MSELTLKVSVDDANLILEALGERPFKAVYALIADLQRQAQSQLRDAGPTDVGPIREADAPDGVILDREPADGVPSTVGTNGS